MKTCSRCKRDLPLTQFSVKRKTRDGLASRCKDCMREIQWFIKYGITPEQYSSLLEAQGHTCAICHRPEPRYKYLAVDHDHSTGAIRGLLCSLCNPMIGYAGNSIEVLKSAIDYLERSHTSG